MAPPREKVTYNNGHEEIPEHESIDSDDDFSDIDQGEKGKVLGYRVLHSYSELVD